MALATYALATPTIGSVDLLDCVGFPFFRLGIYWSGWRIDPGSIAVDVPAPVYIWA